MCWAARVSLCALAGAHWQVSHASVPSWEASASCFPLNREMQLLSGQHGQFCVENHSQSKSQVQTLEGSSCACYACSCVSILLVMMHVSNPKSLWQWKSKTAPPKQALELVGYKGLGICCWLACSTCNFRSTEHTWFWRQCMQQQEDLPGNDCELTAHNHWFQAFRVYPLPAVRR